MNTFKYLPAARTAQVHARRFVLCALSWEQMPEDIRNSAWADWRQRAGLLRSCSLDGLQACVGGLLEEHPESLITVLAVALPRSARAEALQCVPYNADSDTGSNAARVALHYRSLRALQEPETEVCDWLDPQGHVFLPELLDPLPDDIREEWQQLMQVWIGECLAQAKADADRELSDSNAFGGVQAGGDALHARALTLARQRHGLSDNDADDHEGAAPLEADDRERSGHGTAPNERFFGASPLPLAAAAAGGGSWREFATPEFEFPELGPGVRLRIRKTKQFLSTRTSDNDASTAAAVELSFHPLPSPPGPALRLLQIELHEDVHLNARPWAPLPLVLRPSAELPWGPWILTSEQVPWLAARFQAWSSGKLGLKPRVWTEPLR